MSGQEGAPEAAAAPITGPTYGEMIEKKRREERAAREVLEARDRAERAERGERP
jgi:hypothetical protein